MARTAQVLHIRKAFEARLSSAMQLKTDILGLQGAPGTKDLNPSQAHRVVELAFLDMVSGWEVFLDDVIVRYLVGAVPPSGAAPTLRVSRSVGLPAAWQAYTGNPAFDPDRDFVSNRKRGEAIKQGSLLFVNGDPFWTAISGCVPALDNAILIRNRVAHESRKARSDFKRIGAIMRGRALSKGYQAGQLVLEPVQPGLGLDTAKPTYFDAYESLFRNLAAGIVP